MRQPWALSKSLLNLSMSVTCWMWYANSLPDLQPWGNQSQRDIRCFGSPIAICDVLAQDGLSLDLTLNPMTVGWVDCQDFLVWMDCPGCLVWMDCPAPVYPLALLVA